MSTVRQIAKQAGVSIATVSRALNNDPAISDHTRERVLAVAKSEGYVAPPGRRATTHIGYAHVGATRIHDSALLEGVYDSALLDGIVQGLQEHRSNVVILNVRRDLIAGERYAQFFRRMGVRGVILRTTAQSRRTCEAIVEDGVPAVVISERFEQPHVSYVDCDSRADSVRAVEYLISLGHRRIAFAMNVVADCDHLDRFAGYRAALKDNGLPFDERLVFRHPANLSGGATVMDMLVRMADPPTAIYFGDQVLGVGAINKAHQLGLRIPADLSVVGFDDADVRGSVYPRLTAVCQDAVRLGFEAASRLARSLHSTSPSPFKVTIPSFFEINDSTGPPPGHAVRVRPPGKHEVRSNDDEGAQP